MANNEDIGDQKSYIVNDVRSNMRLAPAATFPRWTNDKREGTVVDEFWVGETPVTYELWYEVRVWAENEGYRFANAGLEGSNTGSG